MLELNKVYCADCLDLMREIPDKSVDLVLTDPPYGLDKKLSCGGGKHKDSKFRLGYVGQIWDKVPTQEYFDEIFRVSKNQIICGGNYFSLPATRGIICWDKQQFMPTFSRWEYIWTSFDIPSKIIIESQIDERLHPTQKPIRLFNILLRDFSNEGDIILDPFLGSGTTAIAAISTKRQWIGIEREQAYCDIANKRIEQHLQQQVLPL